MEMFFLWRKPSFFQELIAIMLHCLCMCVGMSVYACVCDYLRQWMENWKASVPRHRQRLKFYNVSYTRLLKKKTSTSHPPSPSAHGRWRKNVYERFASFQVNCFFDKLKRKAFLLSQGDRLGTSASFRSSYQDFIWKRRIRSRVWPVFIIASTFVEGRMSRLKRLDDSWILSS